jgi:hypothetical protein
MPFPATYRGGVRERFRCAARRVTACRGFGDSGKAATCRKLPTGANRKVIAATIAAACCAAMRCVSRRGWFVVAAGANLRFKVMPRYHNNLRRGRRPRRPLFCLPQMFAANHCTRTAQVCQMPSSASALCASGHVTACRTTQRRARCGWASPNSGCHPPALTSGTQG